MITEKSSFRLSDEIIFTILATLSLSIFVLASFFIPFSLPLYIFSLALASLCILKKPEVGLYTIIILTFIFEQFFTLKPIIWDENTYKIYPLDILTIVTLISFLFYKLKFPKIKLLIGKLGAAIIFFIILAGFSTVYGILRGGEVDLAISTFKNYALYSIFFFITINVIRTKEQLKRLVSILVFSSLALFVFIAIGFVRGRGLWIEFTPLSTLGTRLLAPTHAFFLSIASLFLLNLLAAKKSFFGRLTFPIILIQFLGILGSLTRHLWLALPLGLLISFIFLAREYKRNLVKILATQILLILLLITFYGWFSYVFFGEVPILGTEFFQSTLVRLKTLIVAAEDDVSASFRVLAWQKAFELFKMNPVLGIGFGQKITFDFFGFPTRIEVRDLHNNLIGIGLQMGIIGFAFFVGLNIFFLRIIFRALKKIPKELTPYLLGFLGSYILFVISANFGTYFDINLFVIFFWIILAGGVIISKIQNLKIKSQNL
jgi:O-antigen ligase